MEEYAARETLADLERESLEHRLEEPLLETLIGHAVFPRYAFPTDVVTFWVSKPRQPGDAPGKRAFDRDLQLALTEYAPGRGLTIDKWRFESAALYSPYEPTPAHTIGVNVSTSVVVDVAPCARAAALPPMISIRAGRVNQMLRDHGHGVARRAAFVRR